MGAARRGECMSRDKTDKELLNEAAGYIYQAGTKMSKLAGRWYGTPTYSKVVKEITKLTKIYKHLKSKSVVKKLTYN